jgi:hypothetical protein
MWGVVSEVTGLSLTLSQWLSSGLEVKKYNPVNVFYTAVVWALWKSFVFRVSAGKEGMRRVMVNCVKLLRNWGLVNNSEDEAYFTPQVIACRDGSGYCNCADVSNSWICPNFTDVCESRVNCGDLVGFDHTARVSGKKLT